MGMHLVYEFVDEKTVRPGHDKRYSLNGSKLKKMGWKPEISFNKSLEQTVEWTLKNSQWL